MKLVLIWVSSVTYQNLRLLSTLLLICPVHALGTIFIAILNHHANCVQFSNLPQTYSYFQLFYGFPQFVFTYHRLSTSSYMSQFCHLRLLGTSFQLF